MFSCLDTITETSGPMTLDPGYYLIKGPSMQLTIDDEVLEPPPVPHPGKAKVTAPRLAYLLDSGQVTWDDVTHCCKSTASLTADFFDSLVDHLEDIATKEGFDMKKMINSLIGVFGRTHSYLYKSYSSTNKLELLELTSGSSQMTYMNNFGDTFEIVIKTEVKSIKTLRVIFDQILDIETLRIAEIRRQGTSIKNVIPMSCLTDCVTFWSPCRTAEKLRILLRGVVDSSGEPLYRFQETSEEFIKYCPQWRPQIISMPSPGSGKVYAEEPGDTMEQMMDKVRPLIQNGESLRVEGGAGV